MSPADDNFWYLGSPLKSLCVLIFLCLTVVLNSAVLTLLVSCFYGQIRIFRFLSPNLLHCCKFLWCFGFRKLMTPLMASSSALVNAGTQKELFSLSIELPSSLQYSRVL